MIICDRENINESWLLKQIKHTKDPYTETIQINAYYENVFKKKNMKN